MKFPSMPTLLRALPRNSAPLQTRMSLFRSNAGERRWMTNVEKGGTNTSKTVEAGLPVLEDRTAIATEFPPQADGKTSQILVASSYPQTGLISGTGRNPRGVRDVYSTASPVDVSRWRLSRTCPARSRRSLLHLPYGLRSSRTWVIE